MKVSKWTGLVGWLAVTAATAALGAMASTRAKEFYGALELPDWAPPSVVFGPVWTALYLMMAIAAWRVWKKGRWEVRQQVLALFVVQLVLNALWSWLFFAWHQGAAAMLDIVVLWIVVLVTTIGFMRADKVAGWLMVPYLLRITFAAALNYSVWQLNPTQL